jgi:hypothetical protein
VAIGPAVFDASDGPVRASWRRGRNALDKNSAKIFEFRMAGSDGLGQRLLQGLARDRLARDLIVVFFPEDQFDSNASGRIPFTIQVMDRLPLRDCVLFANVPLARRRSKNLTAIDGSTNAAQEQGKFRSSKYQQI